LLLAGGALGLLATPALAEPEYVTIEMEIDVDAPAAEVWSKVGGYCDIGDWFGIPCEITSGEGGIGTVRSLVGGRVIEVLVGQTDLSYGYTQPAVEGQHYNLYHGFLEAQPVTDETSKLVYTLMYDVSEVEDPEADVARRRTQFEGGLARMKEIAEADEEAEADAG
jgi:hypothetical protein